MADPRSHALPVTLVTEEQGAADRARARGGLSVADVIRAALAHYLDADWPRQGGLRVPPGAGLLAGGRRR
jgi:hypothetical protein